MGLKGMLQVTAFRLQQIDLIRRIPHFLRQRPNLRTNESRLEVIEKNGATWAELGWLRT